MSKLAEFFSRDLAKTKLDVKHWLVKGMLQMLGFRGLRREEEASFHWSGRHSREPRELHELIPAVGKYESFHQGGVIVLKTTKPIEPKLPGDKGEIRRKDILTVKKQDEGYTIAVHQPTEFLRYSLMRPFALRKRQRS